MPSNILFRVALVSLSAVLSSACGSQEPEPVNSSENALECGGITGGTCPSNATCEDDPSDDCDPQNGGADCGGICVFITCGGIAGIQCPAWLTCEDDPNDNCNPEKGGADCGGICVPITCGGFAGFECPDGLTCEDDPSDDCDPQNGGADCGGICAGNK